jgi:ABC-type transporter Mla subunit MlaD
MAEEIRLDVVTRADNRGLLEASREIDKLKGRTDALDSSTTSLDRSTDNLGDSFDSTGRDAFDLSAAIEDARKNAAALRAEFARTGEQGLFKDIRGQETLLRRLEKISDEIAKADGTSGVGVTIGSAIGTRAGRGVFSGITDSIQSIPSSARGILIGSAIGIGAVMSPAIGGIVSGAIVGGLGVGGVIGGIVAASGDPRVGDAWKEFAAQSLTPEAFGREAFVGPTIAAIGELQDALDDIDLGDTLEKAAVFVRPLAHGVGDFARNIMPGFNRALDNAGPVIAELSQGFGDMGKALGDMVGDMSEGEGAAKGMRYTFMLLNGAIHVIGDTMHGLGVALDFISDKGAGVTGAMEDIAHWVPFFMPFADAFAEMNDDLERLNAGTTVTIGAIDRTGDAVEDNTADWDELHNSIMEVVRAENLYFERTMAIPEAVDSFEQAIDDFNESLKENGRTFDSNTEKGRNNRDSMRDMVVEAQNIRTAMIAQGQSISDANRAYEENIARIEAIAKAAGITKQQLQQMAGNYRLTFTITTVGRAPRITYGGTVQSFGAGILEYAEGGLVPGPRGMPQLAVVHGGEYVVSNEMQSGGAPTLGGGRMAPIVVTDPLGQMVFTLIRSAVASAGGDVQAFFGQG